MRPRTLALLLSFLLSLSAAADDFVVTSNADAGPGTLRQAILDANAGTCKACRIIFQFPGEPPPRPARQTLRIALDSELPVITSANVRIMAAESTFDQRTEVIVDGSRAGAGAAGLRLNGARSFEMVAVTFTNFDGGGMFVDRTEHATISGCGFNDSGANGVVVRDSTIINLAQSDMLRNRGNGVFLQRSTRVLLEYNRIGVRVIDPERSERAPNAGNGVHADAVSNCQIVANMIQFNGGNGLLVTGNSSENSLEFNEFGDNAFLAIDLGGDGPTANDPLDADEGPNHLQNAPVIDSAVHNRGTLRVRGHLDSVPNARFALSFWTANPDPTGFGEGVLWILAPHIPEVVTDANGHAEFVFDFAASIGRDTGVGAPITALASRIIDQGTWETSEYSRTVRIEEGEVTFEVTNTADSGPGSLRAAIETANASECAASFICRIAFRIPGPPNDEGVWTIRPQSPLPPLAKSGVWIDGLTQTELAGDTNPAGPEIEINGAACAGCNGFEVRAFNGIVALSRLRVMTINGFAGHGVLAQGQAGINLDGLYIGTDPTGTRAVPNGGSGVYVDGASVTVGPVFDDRIPGARGFQRSVISGNAGDGITTTATGSVWASGNIISSDRTGLYPLANGGNGITSGGGDRIESNIIGFSKGAGVLLGEGTRTTGIIRNVIHSNGGRGIENRRTVKTVPPVIESARFADGKTRIRVRIDVPPLPVPQGYWIDLFVSSFTDASGNGEGRRVMSNQAITQSPTTSEFVVDENLTGKFVTVTLTPWDFFYYGPSATTSEFAKSVQVTAAGCEGDPSATLESPANDAESTGATTFRWSAVPNAIVYRMWVMKPGGPVQLVYEGPTPDATVTLEPGTYEWWVETRFACYGTQSEHRGITVR